MISNIRNADGRAITSGILNFFIKTLCNIIQKRYNKAKAILYHERSTLV